MKARRCPLEPSWPEDEKFRPVDLWPYQVAYRHDYPGQDGREPEVGKNLGERSRELSPIPQRASLDALLRFAWEADVFTTGDALGAVGLSRSTTI